MTLIAKILTPAAIALAIFSPALSSDRSRDLMRSISRSAHGIRTGW
jgi:hypothetical protein